MARVKALFSSSPPLSRTLMHLPPWCCYSWGHAASLDIGATYYVPKQMRMSLIQAVVSLLDQHGQVAQDTTSWRNLWGSGERGFGV